MGVAGATLCLIQYLTPLWYFPQVPHGAVSVYLPERRCKVWHLGSVYLHRDSKSHRLIRTVNGRDVTSDEELIQVLREGAQYVGFPIGVGVERDVPWSEALTLLRLLEREGYSHIELNP